MPVELRKRKAHQVPAAAPPPKKSTVGSKVKKVAEKVKKAVAPAPAEDKEEEKATNGTSSKVAVGDTITLEGFGGEIETNDGIVGIGEAGVGGGVTADVIEKDLAPLLVGEDPLLIEYLWQKMFARTRQFGRRGIVMNAISGIDIALWDIAGKVANLPLYRLFGGCQLAEASQALGPQQLAFEVGYARPLLDLGQRPQDD